MTFREARMRCADSLKQAGIENEAAESSFLLEAACGMTKSAYLLYQMDEMPKEQYDTYIEWTRKRCQRIPLQYLTGEQEFMGLPFHVNENVLIPRQDTEIMVEEALKILTGMQGSNPEILDLCTGSGCIGISLKHYFPDCNLSASDISSQALSVARENARLNQVTVSFYESNLFSGISGTFDMIVSNPPYIPSAIIPTLMPEVRDHEPVTALDGQEDGLFFYHQIIEQSQGKLRSGGYLLFEIGYDQGESVSEYMKECGFADIKIIPDLAGMDRVVIGRRL